MVHFIFRLYVLLKKVGAMPLWVWFLVTNGVYLLMVFGTIPHLEGLAGGLPILDMRSEGYGVNDVVALYEALGSEGVRFYLWVQLPIDFVYPLLFMITYAMLLSRLLSLLSLDRGGFSAVVLLPFVTMMLDYVENICTLIAFNSIDSLSEVLCEIGSRATQGKIVMGMVTFAAIVLLGTVWLFKKIRK